VPGCQQLYDELSAYTISKGHEYFIHQHMIDTYCAQHATDETKSIAVVFALMDLYLWLEKGFSGRQVQRVHVLFGKRKREWPKIEFPARRGAVTVADVLKAGPGEARDTMIRKWGEAVWASYAGSEKEKTRQLVDGRAQS
jgi:hypothetical protein